MKIENLKIIYSEITGDVVITNNTQYNKVNAKTITVDKNVTARLFGTIHEKLIIKRGARVYLHGSVLGEIKNSGEIHVFDKEK